MKLRADSKLVRFGYQLNQEERRYQDLSRPGWVMHSRIPPTTSLCEFFWRTFVFVPFALLSGVGVILGAVAVLGVLIYRYFSTFVLTLEVAAIAAVIMGILQLGIKLGIINAAATRVGASIDKLATKVVDADVTQVVLGFIKATKQKMCPIIELDRDAKEWQDRSDW